MLDVRHASITPGYVECLQRNGSFNKDPHTLRGILVCFTALWTRGRFHT